MILEQAVIAVTAGLEDDFEVAVGQAKDLISRAQGFRSLRLLRGVEEPGKYLLLVEWETLDDHTVGFRESELFVRWRELIGPYFASPPEVSHFDPAIDARIGGG